MNLYPLRPICEDCFADCHPHESVINFKQWEENQLCRECNDYAFAAEEKEFRSMPR